SLPYSPQKQAFNPPPYSPSAFTFDPFGDEDEQTSSSSGSYSPALKPALAHGDSINYGQSIRTIGQKRGQAVKGEMQRHQKVEFLKQREWMRRVVAWVDNVNSGVVHPPSLHIPLDNYHHYPYTQAPAPAFDTQCYYSSKEPEPDTVSSDEEPYVIYSTARPTRTAASTRSSAYTPASIVPRSLLGDACTHECPRWIPSGKKTRRRR
ncbi:hypothetical protein EW146_g10182, partial [Bondarzewia mesenterica]